MEQYTRRRVLATSGLMLAGLGGCLGANSDSPEQNSGENPAGATNRETKPGTDGETTGFVSGDGSQQDTVPYGTPSQPRPDRTRHRKGHRGDETLAADGNEPLRELQWNGAGIQDNGGPCQFTRRYWKWVLTPGGSRSIDGAFLSVSFTDGTVLETDGSRIGGRELGSTEFDVVRPRGGTVSEASVAFSGGGPSPSLELADTGCVVTETDIPELVYWQVDFGPGKTPPDPPWYRANDLDLMAAVGNTVDGVSENPSAGPWSGHGQFDDVRVVGSEFSFDDEGSPSTAAVDFEIDENGGRQDLHIASFLMPGPFSVDEIENQQLFSLSNGTYEPGDSGTLSVSLPNPE